MNTELQTPPAVVLSTALLERFEDAVGSYWDCAYQEGHLNRPDGDKANAILHDIRCAVDALVLAEREACAKVCDEREREPLDDEAPLVWLRAASAIRERSNAESNGRTSDPTRTPS